MPFCCKPSKISLTSTTFSINAVSAISNLRCAGLKSTPICAIITTTATAGNGAASNEPLLATVTFCDSLSLFEEVM